MWLTSRGEGLGLGRRCGQCHFRAAIQPSDADASARGRILARSKLSIQKVPGYRLSRVHVSLDHLNDEKSPFQTIPEAVPSRINDDYRRSVTALPSGFEVTDDIGELFVLAGHLKPSSSGNSTSDAMNSEISHRCPSIRASGGVLCSSQVDGEIPTHPPDKPSRTWRRYERLRELCFLSLS